MHVKSDSEVTSIDASTPPRSPRRPLYYVQSPSQHDVEKMSYGSSPLGSPHHYHCSPIHHSRESSTTRFSASLKNPRNPAAWKKIQRNMDDDDDEEDEDDDYKGSGNLARFYILCFVFSFIVLFTVFSLILWGASKPYKPKISMKSIVFESFNIQAGMDHSGVPTDMLSLNSTVKFKYRNPATFFGVHVSSTPVELHYYQLKVAFGHMKEFYQSRKSERKVVTRVVANQVPLYGGVSALGGTRPENNKLDSVNVPLNLTFVVRSRAYVLGRLVKPKFYRRIRCLVTLKGGNHLGKPIDLKLCDYN
ncbi:Late embryogenesis abundant protein [Macleaya cordata]|uniref:Late embryogenesis abundant protein n=1 Tax=Macleaya cordata TaxID=56857 RepID=A0A200QZY3_MACCD|nr:Late embryogenesis abundant protein [Macleaya cordata]